MTCKDMHYIYCIDKKRVQEDIIFLCGKNIFNLKNLYALGRGNFKAGLIDMLTGKEWVFYDRNPAKCGKGIIKKLARMGYFKYFDIPCGKCEICRTEKSKEWATKAWCEGQMWKNSCFITLTYDNEHLPEDRKLKRSDIQKFWKDLRYHLYKETKRAKKVDLSEERNELEEIYSNPIEDTFGKNAKRKNRYPIRYLNCGEYGPATKRPHYHAQVWNFMPADLKYYKTDPRGHDLFNSEKLSKIWGKGFVVIEYATAETAAYIARYCTKKAQRSQKEIEKMKKKKQIEFIGASTLGFIGYFYWIKFKDMIKRNAGILMKRKNHTILAKIPKIMQKYWKEENEDEFEEYDYWKCKTGKENWDKILSKTTLNESEYIEETCRIKNRQLERLTRKRGDFYGDLTTNS
ncbi:replication initiator protein [Dipodfec virus UOA04_Rod_615]|nr:replication initiator protein [Dipodfec virus UOA04_Rod_615]